MSLPRSTKVLALGFAVSGVIHLVKPDAYEPLMPAWAAGLASALLLVGVYPGNIKMAVDASRTNNTAFKVAAFGRLPLQIPMIRAALRATQ